MFNPVELIENESSIISDKLCIICREAPQSSRLYKCNMGGHVICCSCFVKLPKSGGARCAQCNSIFIKIHDSHVGLVDEQRKITVEELFRLPTEQVNLLLNKTSRETLATDRNSEVVNIIKRTHPAANSQQTQVCKPFKCPHLPCGKTVNSTSLKAHFIYEHSDIKTYLLKRGEELLLATNVSVIDHGMTYCLGLIEVYDEYNVVTRAFDGIYKKFNQKVPVAVFWLLVSGSVERDVSKAYALYWLVTDSDLPFKCTLEMSSISDNCSCATFCGVNDIRDDLSTLAVGNKMNCLYLSYGSLLNLKGLWGEVKLQITIH